MKVMSVFGTRPEAIKMCPLVKELEKHPEIESVVCLTGQHREMLQQVIDIFQTKVHYNLDIMRQCQTLTTITADILTNIQAIFEKEKPDLEKKPIFFRLSKSRYSCAPAGQGMRSG